MAETIPGGAYLAEDGKTWHDAEGRPLSKEAQAAAEKQASEKEAAVEQLQQQEAANAAMAQSALARALIGNAAVVAEAPSRRASKKE